MIDEFSLISQYFADFSDQIGDDCAILPPEDGRELALSVDTLVEGTHFPPDAPPEQVGYRAVVTALSDLAAAGAKPRAILLALTLPAPEPAWLQPFASGVGQALRAYELALIGGDTTRGPLAISVTALGSVACGRGITRRGARPGDGVYISGPTGDAAAALALLRGQLRGQWPGHRRHRQYLLQRFYRPTARTELGQQLVGVASSAIDLSDGLLADAQHLCQRSGVGMRIDAELLPLSAALRSVREAAPASQSGGDTTPAPQSVQDADPAPQTVQDAVPAPQPVQEADQALRWALTGGDDYELLFTVPPDHVGKVPSHCTRIGEVVEGDSVHCNVDVGPETGYVHFTEPPPSCYNPPTAE